MYVISPGPMNVGSIITSQASLERNLIFFPHIELFLLFA